MKTAALFLFLLLAGCGHAKPGAPPSRLAVSVQPAPKAVLAIQKRRIEKAKAQPGLRFAWADRTFEIGAGVWKNAKNTADWNELYGWGPVAWVRTGKETRALDLRELLPSHFVSYAFHDERAGKIVLFLEFGVEGPSPAYLVWISEDRGEHWFAGGELTRPPGEFPPAELEEFYLDAEGKGAAWFKSEAANLPEEKRAGAPNRAEVFFRATTSDGARSWAMDPEPKFSTVLKKEKAVFP